MSRERTYIAGDWGTSGLRLFLCAGQRVIERCEGPGVAQLTAAADPAAFSRTLLRLTAPWREAHGAVPMWLAGMIGSRSGWREAPYVPCPADACSLAAATLRFTADDCEISIAPGVACTNPRNAPDVMRGEETQVIGTLALHPALARGHQVLALPGTHTKWVVVEDGRITAFQTSLSGELYGLLCRHSTLAQMPPATDARADAALQPNAFESGARRARELQAAPLSHLLFEVRSRQLQAGMSRPEAFAFLSGLIIGQDVLGAVGLFDGAPRAGACVPIIGAADLTERYRIVLAGQGIEAVAVDASQAALCGLQAFAALIQNGEAKLAPVH